MTLSSGFQTRRKLLAMAVCCVLYGNNAVAQIEGDVDEAELDMLNEGSLIEEVVIWGVRASQAKAIDLKRTSANVLDSIVAEDIGRMPDTTITDSLQRVPGVQINREANEGTTLNVRGMPQVLTTLNGEQFLSPWTITGVGANYTDIPAGMIGAVDVYKSMSSDQVAGGISGLIDLKTIDPAELESGWTAKFKAELSEGSRRPVNADGIDNDISFYVGHKQDRFSIIFGGFTASTTAANYQVEIEPRLGFLDEPGGTPGDPFDLNHDGDLVNDWYSVPEEYGASSNFMERDRTGLTLGMHFEINDNWSARSDIFYTAMDQADRGVGAYFAGNSHIGAYEVNNAAPDYAENLYNVALDGSVIGKGHSFSYKDINGNNITRTLYSLQVAQILSPEFQSKSTSERNNTGALNTNFELNFKGDNLDASFRLVHSIAERKMREAQMDQGSPAWLWVDQDGLSGKDPLKGYAVAIDYRKDIPVFNFNDDVSSAELLRKYQGFASGEDTEASLSVLRADMTYSFDNSSFVRSVDAGIRYGIREAEKNSLVYVAPTGRYSVWADPRVPIDKQYLLREGNEVWAVLPDWREFDYTLEDIQLRTIGGLQANSFGISDTIAYTDFGPIQGFGDGVASIDPSEWDNPLAFMNRLYPGSKTIKDPGTSYEVSEASTSLYGQVNYEFDVGFPISGNLGLRIVHTSRSVDKPVLPQYMDSFNSVGYDIENRIPFVYDIESVDYSYTDVLPTLNVNFYPWDDWVFRFAASQTTARNDLENVGSGLDVVYQQCTKTDNGNVVYVTDANGNQVADTVSCVQEASDRGNAKIDPWKATVINGSAEWYFGDNAVVTGGLFLITVDSSVEEYQEQRSFVDADGIDRNHLANVWTTSNAGASDLYGLELGYRQPFTFLPGILSSTGVELNYTYSNSESADTDIDGDALPLPSNSAHQTNLILWYEKDAFSVRMAYNWRSAEYIDRVRLVTNDVPLSLGNWQEPTGYLDISFGYWLNDTVSFFADLTNVTEENRRTYSQYEEQFQSLFVQERRISAGVTLSL